MADAMRQEEEARAVGRPLSLSVPTGICQRTVLQEISEVCPIGPDGYELLGWLEQQV